MTKEEKLKLREVLPKGWAVELVRRTGFSVQYIRAVMIEGRNQIEIEEAAITLAREYKERLEQQKRLITNILQPT